MNNYFDFSSDDFFIGTAFNNSKITDKENFISILVNKKLDINNITNANQVHSSRILFVMKPGTYHNLDGFITNKNSKLILIIKTADCIPMFIYDKVNKNHGIIHAGWKGIHNKIHLNIINEFIKLGSSVSHLNIIMGPSIKSCCYEVSENMKKYFGDQSIIVNNKKYYLDLNNCIINDLRNEGIKNIKIDQTCTYEDKKCYSYRRNSKGRMYSFITLL